MNAPGQGRKPKPTALRVLQGNPGKRRLNDKEPKPKPGTPSAPPFLTDEAKREWRRVSKQLLALGLLTLIDKAALAAYCVAWGRWAEAETALREFGIFVMTPVGMVENPALRISDNARKQMMRALVEFGMSPSSRSRVHSELPEPEKDEFEEMMRRGSRPA